MFWNFDLVSYCLRTFQQGKQKQNMAKITIKYHFLQMLENSYSYGTITNCQYIRLLVLRVTLLLRDGDFNQL